MSSPILLGPILIYGGAALLIPRFRFLLGQRGQMVATLLATVAGFLATLLISHRAAALSDALTWQLSDWGGVNGGRLLLQADSVTLPAILLVALVGMLVYLGTLDDVPVVVKEEYDVGLLVILAGVVGMALSANLLTLLATALVMDLGIAYGLGLAGRTRWLLAALLQSLIATMLTLAAALLLWNSSGRGGFELLATRPASLAVLALAVRLAPLPLTFYPLAIEALPARVRGLLPLLTLGAGGLLAGRLAPLVITSTLPLFSLLLPLAAVGVALAGWVAWRSQDRTMRLAMLAAGQGAWALWAFTSGAPEEAVAVAWGAIPALATLALATERLSLRRLTPLPALVAGLILVGLPGSALWGAVTHLGGKSWLGGDWWLLTLAVIGLMTSTVAVIELLTSGDEQAPPPSRLAAMTLLAALSVPLFAVLWGVHSPTLAQPPLPTPPMWGQIALPLVGWAGGWWLWRARPWTTSLAPLLDRVGDAFSFAWLWRLLGRSGWLALRTFQGGMRVVEGENYGWLLFFLLVTLIYFWRG